MLHRPMDSVHALQPRSSHTDRLHPPYTHSLTHSHIHIHILTQIHTISHATQTCLTHPHSPSHTPHTPSYTTHTLLTYSTHTHTHSSHPHTHKYINSSHTHTPSHTPHTLTHTHSSYRHTHTLSHSPHLHTYTHTHKHKHKAYRGTDTGNTGTQGQCSHTRHVEHVGTAQSPSWGQSLELAHTGSHWNPRSSQRTSETAEGTQADPALSRPKLTAL